jgi:hypothetical protein
LTQKVSFSNLDSSHHWGWEDIQLEDDTDDEEDAVEEDAVEEDAVEAADIEVAVLGVVAVDTDAVFVVDADNMSAVLDDDKALLPGSIAGPMIHSIVMVLVELLQELEEEEVAQVQLHR